MLPTLIRRLYAAIHIQIANGECWTVTLKILEKPRAVLTDTALSVRLRIYDFVLYDFIYSIKEKRLFTCSFLFIKKL